MESGKDRGEKWGEILKEFLNKPVTRRDVLRGVAVGAGAAVAGKHLEKIEDFGKTVRYEASSKVEETMGTAPYYDTGMLPDKIDKEIGWDLSMALGAMYFAVKNAYSPIEWGECTATPIISFSKYFNKPLMGELAENDKIRGLINLISPWFIEGEGVFAVYKEGETKKKGKNLVLPDRTDLASSYEWYEIQRGIEPHQIPVEDALRIIQQHNLYRVRAETNRKAVPSAIWQIGEHNTSPALRTEMMVARRDNRRFNIDFDIQHHYATISKEYNEWSEKLSESHREYNEDTLNLMAFRRTLNDMGEEMLKTAMNKSK